jgi:hypothetical protein
MIFNFFFLVQMILNFQKEIILIMYIIVIYKKNWIISFEQNLNKIWILKVYVFVMFKVFDK